MENGGQQPEWKPKGGRPKLAAGEKRGVLFNIRLTAQERKDLGRLATEAGYKDAAAYARKRLLTSGEAASFNPKPLFRAIDKTGAELKKIGNNMNQIARYVHYLDQNNMVSEKVITEYNRHFQEMIRVEDAYVKAIRAYLRTTRG